MTDQYQPLVEMLTPIMDGLPGKLIAIDGRPGVGKTTLGRYLAWRFNVSLVEGDLFRIIGGGVITHTHDEVSRIIDYRLERECPIIVESVAVLRLLKRVGHEPDFLIYVSSEDGADCEPERGFWPDLISYEKESNPRTKANFRLDLQHDP